MKHSKSLLFIIILCTQPIMRALPKEFQEKLKRCHPRDELRVSVLLARTFSDERRASTPPAIPPGTIRPPQPQQSGLTKNKTFQNLAQLCTYEDDGSSSCAPFSTRPSTPSAQDIKKVLSFKMDKEEEAQAIQELRSLLCLTPDETPV